MLRSFTSRLLGIVRCTMKRKREQKWFSSVLMATELSAHGSMRIGLSQCIMGGGQLPPKEVSLWQKLESNTVEPTPLQ